jgi:formylglycine-generating enzyme required for sulfatase activity
MTSRRELASVIRRVRLALLVASLAAASAFAQTRPILQVDIAGARRSLRITGDLGRVYSIQVSTSLSANSWSDRTLFQVRTNGNVWTDPDGAILERQFYRAVSVPVPVDTNLVFIQPGEFIMGSPTDELDRGGDEGPQTAVTISRGFWIGRYAVTQGEFLALIGTNPSQFPGDTTRPVETVSWDDATNYCALLTAKALTTGQIPANSAYRLPTEAEWEYACRAGTTNRFYYGDDLDYTNLANYAWYRNNSGATQPVGRKLPNRWDLYDMHGNVFVWCQDFYGPYQGGHVVDPQGPTSGSTKVIRGGCWGCVSWRCRSATRGDVTPDFKSNAFGFRLVLALREP